MRAFRRKSARGPAGTLHANQQGSTRNPLGGLQVVEALFPQAEKARKTLRTVLNESFLQQGFYPSLG